MDVPRGPRKPENRDEYHERIGQLEQQLDAVARRRRVRDRECREKKKKRIPARELPQHKGATLTADDEASGAQAGDRFTRETFTTLLAEEYQKLLAAGNRDVHDVSKHTTLPIAREIVATYVLDDVKLPWYVDLLNINLDNHNLAEAKRRIAFLTEAFKQEGRRVTENVDFAVG